MLLYDNYALRNELRKKRQSLSRNQQTAYSEAVSVNIAASHSFILSKTIMIYKAVRGEIDLTPLESYAYTAGKIPVYPVCLSKTEMAAYKPLESAAWHTGAFGITEPIIELSEKISPDQIDLVVCPLLAFDEKCHRIGSGAGYYDRFLPSCSHAVIAAAAYEFQKIPEIIPAPWDIPMDLIFTEQRIYTHEQSVQNR